MYSLLQGSILLNSLKPYPSFTNWIDNLTQTMSFFQRELNSARLKSPSLEEVLEVIDQVSLLWLRHGVTQLKSLPSLSFTFEESKEKDCFFIPYIWNLIHNHGLIYWDESKARLLMDLTD